MNKTIMIGFAVLIVSFLTCNRGRKDIDGTISKNKIAPTVKSENQYPVKKSLLIEIDKIDEKVSQYASIEKPLFFMFSLNKRKI